MNDTGNRVNIDKQVYRMSKISLLVLGNFGLTTNQLDGQTVKTRNIYSLLKLNENQLGEIQYFDTQQFRKNKFAILAMFMRVIKSNKLIYIPAHNNLKYIFPFIFFVCMLFRTRILYIVVGGWLVEYLKNKPVHRALLHRVDCIFPQTTEMVTKLNEIYDFSNLVCLPNFRIHKFKPDIKNSDTSFRIVFMARINSMKGIDTVFRIAEYFHANNDGTKTVSIDFWGPIAKADKENFLLNIENHENTTYKGQLEPDLIYETLSHYDVLVLPTKYFTEGFPGSILDAYISGIPVIVTKWKHALEFVENAKTGFIVPFSDGEKLMIQHLKKLYYDQDLLLTMKGNAYEKSKEYSAEIAYQILKKYL